MRKRIMMSTMFMVFTLSFTLSFVSMLAQPAAAYVSMTVSSTSVPSTIQAGKSGNLVITIANGGTSYARNVKLTIKSHSYVTFGQKKYELQTIAPSSSTQVSVPITILSSIPTDTTSIFMTIEYSEGSSTATSTFDTSTSLSVSKRSLVQIDNLTWSEETIEPGDVVTADVYIENVGQSSLRDMIVTFGNSTMPFVPAEGDMEKYLGDLAVGGVTKASFSIILNKDARTIAYRVPIAINYYDDSGTSHSDAKYVGMKVTGTPDFVVTLEEDSKALSGSGAGEITISLANRGTATAGYMTLEFDSNLDITPSEYYVGNLDPDDYETVTLEIDLLAIPSGKRDLNIYMTYKDPYNQDVSESAYMSFTVHAIPPVTVSPMNMVIIAAAVLAILYWKRKFFTGLLKRKK
jgi:hypothetical protein